MQISIIRRAAFTEHFHDVGHKVHLLRKTFVEPFDYLSRLPPRQLLSMSWLAFSCLSEPSRGSGSDVWTGYRRGILMSPAVKTMGIGFMGFDMPAMPVTVVLAHAAYGLILGLLCRR